MTGKIVHIGNPSYELANGVSRSIADTITALHSINIDVEIWKFSRKVQKPTESKFNAIKFWILPVYGFKGWLGSFLQFPKLSTIKFLLKRRSCVSLFHLHSTSQADHLWIIFLGVPFFITPHGGYLVIKKSIIAKLKNIWVTFLDIIILKRARLVLALNEIEFQKIRKMCKSANVELSPPIYIERDSDLPANDFNINEKYILYIGRLEMELKGLDLLLKSWSLIKEKHGYHLRIYGSGLELEKQKIRDLVAHLGIGDSVVLKEAIFGIEKVQLIKNASYSILLSKSEGMPLSIVESLSKGVPVIVTESTNIGAFISDYEAGFVAENNCESIALILREAVATSDVQMAYLKSNSLRLYSEKFAIENALFFLLSKYRLAM